VGPADTSTGIVLNALQARGGWNRDAIVVTHKRYVTTNHFDTDSFLSCWCYINRKTALEHEGGEGAATRHVLVLLPHLLQCVLGVISCRHHVTEEVRQTLLCMRPNVRVHAFVCVCMGWLLFSVQCATLLLVLHQPQDCTGA
jgi:hypothetical protein